MATKLSVLCLIAGLMLLTIGTGMAAGIQGTSPDGRSPGAGTSNRMAMPDVSRLSPAPDADAGITMNRASAGFKHYEVIWSHADTAMLYGPDYSKLRYPDEVRGICPFYLYMKNGSSSLFVTMSLPTVGNRNGTPTYVKNIWIGDRATNNKARIEDISVYNGAKHVQSINTAAWSFGTYREHLITLNNPVAFNRGLRLQMHISNLDPKNDTLYCMQGLGVKQEWN